MAAVAGKKASGKKASEWLSEYSKSIAQTLPHAPLKPNSMLHGSYVSLENFPVIQLNSLYSDLFAEKFVEAEKRARKMKLAPVELARALSPTILRKGLFYLLLDVELAKLKKEVKHRLADFFYDMLWIATAEDEFAFNSNKHLGDLDVAELVNLVKWEAPSNEQQKLDFGNLYLSAKGLSESLYSYYFAEASFENYGPFDVSEFFGKDTRLVITDYKDLKPRELWQESRNVPLSSLRLFAVYHDTSIELNAFNQMKVDKPLVEKLRHFAVVGDSKALSGQETVASLGKQFAELASKQYLRFSDLFPEEMKRKMVDIRHYEFKPLFDLLGMNWRPSSAVYKRVHGKEIFSLPVRQDAFVSTLVAKLK